MAKINPQSTTFRLSEEARRILAHLADSQGISRTAVLELLLRKAYQERPAKRPATETKGE